MSDPLVSRKSATEPGMARLPTGAPVSPLVLPAPLGTPCDGGGGGGGSAFFFVEQAPTPTRTAIIATVEARCSTGTSFRISNGSVAEARYGNNGDHAGSDASSGVFIVRSFAPDRSTEWRSTRPRAPACVRKNRMTRPLGDQVGPSS